MRLAILQHAHLGSHRIKRKLLEDVGGSSLLDRGIEKLMTAAAVASVPLVVACPENDSFLTEYLDFRGVRHVPVLAGDADADDYSSIMRGYRDELTRDFDRILVLNALCRPFLKLGTITSVINHAKVEECFVCTIEERGILWTAGDGFSKLRGFCVLPDTKTNPAYNRLSHVGYCHPTNTWDEVAVAARLSPWSIPLTPAERIDIDTPDDLEFAQTYAIGLKVSNSANPNPFPPSYDSQGWLGKLDF
jgi:hypothetical protein